MWGVYDKHSGECVGNRDGKYIGSRFRVQRSTLEAILQSVYTTIMEVMKEGFFRRLSVMKGVVSTRMSTWKLGNSVEDTGSQLSLGELFHFSSSRNSFCCHII